MKPLDPLDHVPRPLPPRFRWVKRFLIVMGSLVALSIVMVVSVRYAVLVSNRRKTEAVISKLDQVDPGWRSEALEAARMVIPDAENSAIPLRAANRLMPSQWPTILATQVAKPPASEEADPSGVIVPLIETEYFSQPNEKQITALRAELAALAPVLAEARKVLDKPQGRYALIYALDPFQTLLPDAQKARNTARILKLDAILRIQDGDIDGALDSSRAMINVGRSIGDEPFLISQLVRMAIVRVAVHSIERVLASGEPSEMALASVQVLLEDEETQPLFRYGIRGERAMLNDFYARLASGELAKMSDEEIPPILQWLYAEAMQTHARGVVLEEMAGFIAAAEAPLSEQRDLVESCNQGISGRSAKGGWDKWARLLLPAVSSFAENHVASKARLRTAIIAVAAERYRRKNGQWPESVDQLAPWPLNRIPTNPYDDEPLLWLSSEEDESLIIYSPGPDQSDDKGVLEQDPPPPPIPKGQLRPVKTYWEGKDIGFRLRNVSSRSFSKTRD